MELRRRREPGRRAMPELIEDGVNGLLVPPGRSGGAGRGARGADRAIRRRACGCGRAGAARACSSSSRMAPGLDRLAARLGAELEQAQPESPHERPWRSMRRSSRPTTRSRRAIGAWRAR